MLKSSELRDIIKEIDSSKQASKAIELHMKNEKFKNFAGLCLDLVENEDVISDIDSD